MLLQDLDFRLLEAKAQSAPPHGQGIKDTNLKHSKSLTLNALNHLLSHRCGYKHSWGHM